MNLLENPFHILGVTPIDTRRAITEVAEDKSLFLDTDICNDARTTLTAPAKRLFAELAWLTHSNLQYADKLITLLEQSPTKLLEQVLESNKLHAISKINLFITALLKAKDYDNDDFVNWIINIAESFDNIDIDEIFEEINLSREVSGFPKITDKNVIKEELIKLEQYYSQSIKKALEEFDSRELVQVMIDIVEQATDDGDDECPFLIKKLIDLYELEVQEFFANEEKNIDNIITKFNRQLEENQEDVTLNATANELVRVVKNWDFIAQPIQVKCKSQGVKHEISTNMAHKLRNLSIDTYNKYQKIDLARKLNAMLQEVFAELPDMLERLDDDKKALSQISEDIERGRKIFNERVANNSEEPCLIFSIFGMFFGLFLMLISLMMRHPIITIIIIIAFFM